MELLKHTIPLQEQEDIAGVIRALSGLKNVVNISDSEGIKPFLFCEDNLRDLLSRSPNMLFVEALALGEYKKMTREKVDQVTRAALSLRAALRTRYASELATGVREFAVLADQLLLMLSCYGLQNAGSGVGTKAAELQKLLAALASSCFEQEDNVRCMDGLQYEILPGLKILLKVFRK